jgi:hypothetical protein
MGALRAREALAGFGKALPEKILKFNDAQVDKSHVAAGCIPEKGPRPRYPLRWRWLPGRLKTPRELIRLATKPARSRRATDVAATPYAIPSRWCWTRSTTNASPCALP